MLTFTENGILQKSAGFKKNWSVQDLLETYEPLAGEPLAIRNDAMRRILPMAEEAYSKLSERAILRCDFWKQLLPQRIAVQQYEYSIKISQIYQWELSVTPEGLFYKDISPLYGQMRGTVHEQLFSDFWFYGPIMPLPDLATRKWVVANIRNAFLQIGPVSQKHFQLFEYPDFASLPKWEDGDHNCQDYILMRPYGIEHGRTNWHDGLVYHGFISFERFLADPVSLERLISPKIREEMLAYFPLKSESKVREEDTPLNNLESKRLFMESGGNLHNIGRDGNMDIYRATPAEEAVWRAELIDKYTVRLQQEDNETVLGHIAQTLQNNGVKNVSDLLCEAGKKVLPKAQQSIAELLIKQYDAEKGAEVLIALLDYEEEDSYWRNYVFNRMFRMRDYKTIQQFIIQCLRGGNQTHFKKAVDVLQMWSLYGESALADRNLLSGLNWEDACAADPNFHQTLKRVERIIRREF